MSKYSEEHKLYPTLDNESTWELEDTTNAEETERKVNASHSPGDERSSGRPYNLRPRSPLQGMRTSTKQKVDAWRSPHRSRSSEPPTSGPGGGGRAACPGSPGGSTRSPAEAPPDQTDGVRQRRQARSPAGSSPEQSSDEHSEGEQPPARPTSARPDRRTPPGGRPASWNSATSQLPGACPSASSKADLHLSPLGWAVVVAAVVTVVTLLAVAWYLSGGGPPPVGLQSQSVSPAVSRWVDAVAALSARFPYQRPGLWKVLRATVSRMLLQGWQPAVLVLAGGELQRDELACLTSAVADAVRRATGSHARPVTLDGAALARLEADEANGRVVAALDSLRGRDGSGAGVDLVVVRDLQRLRPLTAMLLHGFTDNDNAPRKQAVFLLQVVTSPPPPASQDSLSVAVEAQLGRAWRPALSEEVFDALLGRIAGNVVAVAEEGDALVCGAHA